MNEKLKKSPLTYVLMQVKISQVLDIESYIQKIQELIRREFPLFKSINVHAIEMKQNNEQPEFKRFTQWHFGDKTNTTGILVARDAIMIHTSDYHSFESLSATFENIIEKFKDALDISLFTRTGIRYNNLIHSNVAKYLNPHLQGFYINNESRFIDNYVARTETVQQTKCGGIIKIQSTHISDKNRLASDYPANNIFVTPDLWQSADQLNFENHNKKSPKKDFLILDIDHFIKKQDDFVPEKIIAILKELHNDAYFAFSNAVTEEALNDWK